MRKTLDPASQVNLEQSTINFNKIFQFNRYDEKKPYLSPSHTKARIWDFDLTIANLEPTYRLICEVASEELFGLSSNKITHNEWNKIFASAFGLTTEGTNNRIVEIFRDKDKEKDGAYSGVYSFAVERLETVGITNPHQKLVEMLGVLRQEVFDLFVNCSDLRISHIHGDHIKWLSVTDDLIRVDKAAKAAFRSRSEDIAEILPANIKVKERQISQLRNLSRYPKQCVRLLPHVDELIDKSAEMGQIQAVVSSSNTNIIAPVIEKFDLTDKFITITGANDVDLHKPHPKPHIYTIDQINKNLNGNGIHLDRGDFVEVMEDTASGWIAAVRAGFIPIVIAPVFSRFYRTLMSKVQALPQEDQYEIINTLTGHDGINVVNTWRAVKIGND